MVQAIFLAVRVAFFYSSVGKWHFFGLVACDAVLFLAYRFFEKQAVPAYDSEGQLLYGGGDIGSAGVNEYLHDIVYILWFVLAASWISDYIWLAILAVRLRETVPFSQRANH